MKFKFNDRVKVIGDGFYSGQVGTIVGYDNFNVEIYTILLPYNIKASLDAEILEKVLSTESAVHPHPFYHK